MIAKKNKIGWLVEETKYLGLVLCDNDDTQ